MTREIPLTRGLVALVDDTDFEDLMQLGPWHAAESGGRFYAVHTRFTPPAHFGAVRMHKVLLPAAEFVDHVNRNSLDNRRSNLRPATASQNSRNRRRRSDSKWPYKGIRLDRGGRRWQAVISVDGRAKHLGMHSTAEEAARAYDTAASEHFGEYASLNFPQENAS